MWEKDGDSENQNIILEDSEEEKKKRKKERGLFPAANEAHIAVGWALQRWAENN